MSKIDNLKAVANDFDIPVSKLIDMVQSYSDKPPVDIETLQVLTERIVAAEKIELSADYINGLKDARKLLATPGEYREELG